MKREENPWSKGIVLICTKCHKSISSKLLEEEGNSAENLKMFLKKTFKESGDSSKIRIVTSSCLDVCIDDTQAVSYAGTDGETETFAIHPEKDREKFLKYLKEKIE
ncbi:(2Fe-2S) ferredoxin domain-containing protein [Bdellovibrio sp.]|uniref:(2Fe-2S) ferredoxin domain-containing protein n=1 Tax=Bdellovibrio TaxID=958 RepID=UPI0032213F44